MKNLSVTTIAITLLIISNHLNAQSNEYIRKRSEDLTDGLNVYVNDEKIYCQKLLPEFYQRRQFGPAWTTKDKRELLEVLGSANDEGLNASDYHYDVIREFSKKPQTTLEKAELDLLLTDAFLLYASHFLNGKVNPETVNSEWKAIRREGNALEFLEKAIETDHIRANLIALEPKFQGYLDLKTALQNYRDIKEKQGGWAPVPSGETLKVGMIDSVRVPLIIARLIGTNDLESKPDDMFTYSEKVSLAIRVYQLRNGLVPDGNLGQMTLASLNVPVEDRIDQIKINMERYRWISRELGYHYILVNIADYQLSIYKEDKLTYEEKVIVGKPYRKTPVFSSKMTYMVVNPTWTVPPTILFNDILPEVIKNPGYLETKKIRVLQGQGSNATIIDPQTIDWSTLSKGNFPYTLRQDAGPTNALGVLKFMFPNTYNVYIHDTPGKELFARPDRAFSSGCIRINNPLSFANYLLKDNPKWNNEKLMKLIASGIEQSIIFEQPVNVHILYLTSWSQDGKTQFRNDLYNRDRQVLEALNQKPPAI